MERERPGYIVVEGPIGVGKTSLAKRLAKSFETDLLLEGADENPFLERFYQDPRSGALPAQLFFLFFPRHTERNIYLPTGFGNCSLIFSTLTRSVSYRVEIIIF